MKKRILFMDNSRTFLDVHARLLEQKGYVVLRALTIEHAEEKFREEHVHLAVLDIRMEDEDDDQDIGGLLLARKAEYQAIPKIILTAHTKHSDSYKYVRDALEPLQNGRAAAIGFVGKTEGPDALLQAVERAFAQQVRIHWDLTIRWKGSTSLFYLTNLLEPTIDGVRLSARVDELECLLRKLFYQHSQITIGRLLVQKKQKIILEIYAYGSGGTEEQFVVACGDRHYISDESSRYATFVHKWGGPVNTMQRETVETGHFAATLYHLTGSNLEELVPLHEFYSRHRTDEVLDALDHLFTSLAPWYTKNRFYVEDKSLNTLYRQWLGLEPETFGRPAMEQRMEALCKAVLAAGSIRLDYAPQKLTFYLADGSCVFYANPNTYLYPQEVTGESVVFYSVIHGCMDASDILIDQTGRTWLVDFAETGEGLLLRDFVSLEMAIRLDLLDINDLQMCYEFEQQLLTSVKLNDAISVRHFLPELDKPLRTIERIRHQAAAVTNSDLAPYLAGLFFCALARVAAFDPTIRYTRRELIPFVHSLLLAAMLGEKLTGVAQSLIHLSPQALDNLWLQEDNREVWVESKKIDLTPQDFDILAYLYRNRSQPCSRQEIVEKALSEVYKEETTETSRLNSAMSRLRQKIEADPDHPKYIITVRGYGYKLM